MRKNDVAFAQNGLPSHRKPVEGGGTPNVSKSRGHQNLSNTVYRIEIGLVEKRQNSIAD